MEATSIVMLVSGIVIGSLLGFFISKLQLGRAISELQLMLDNEKTSHEQTKKNLSQLEISLNKISETLQIEQKEHVKFETQYNEAAKQIEEKSRVILSLNEDILKLNDSLIKAESLRTKAETTLNEANLSISELKLTIEKLNSEKNVISDENISLKTANADFSAKYNEAVKAINEQKKFIEDINTSLRESFGLISSEALKRNNDSFIALAKTTLEKYINESRGDLEKRQQAIDSMLKPINESLNKFDNKIQEIEKARQGAYSEIKVFLDNVKETTTKLQKETNTLVSALKTSHVRGRYGEIGLRRVVEFAGMSEFCDFDEQTSLTTEAGRLRPDMIVNLPGQRRVIVDAKVPLASYIQIFETIDENDKKGFMIKHAAAVREHLKTLSSKSYWSQFQDSPDYVIMYMQIESSFGAALEIDRSLIEDAMNNKIIFATPTTLITMLKTIAFSWQQVRVAENIYQIRDAGVELYNRINTLIQHISLLGQNLNQATQNYNKVIGSLESRFIPQVKKLKEIGGSLMDKDIPETKSLETSVRTLNELPKDI